ncbi:TlyA family rRNA (cytidine-2'-O)-methyltransferase [soil metagenome]
MLVGGAPATNPSRLVAAHEAVARTRSAPPFVSRGGQKLHAALGRFDVSLVGRRVLDVGASTGGFTDCALQAGAASVVALDVGWGQLHHRLRSDDRVEVFDRTNIRHVDPSALGRPAEAAVVDLSFISLRLVLDALLTLVSPGGDLIWLVKPQFEATKTEVDLGRGVIGDAAVWARVLRTVMGTLDQRGAAIMGVMTSPLRGADGNVEFLLHAMTHGPGSSASSVRSDDFEAHIGRAVTQAVAP